MERDCYDRLGEAPAGATVEVCGLGPVAAAAYTARRLAEHRPAAVLLVGIAGSYDVDAAPVGSAREFSEVVIDGIGAGEGQNALGPGDLGFAQVDAVGGRPAVFDRIDLAASAASAAGHRLLTVCSASDGEAMADLRRSRHPGVLAEDMEGFGVALACDAADVPLRIVRGMSNSVGDRSTANWLIEPALAAAKALVQDLIRVSWKKTDPSDV